MAELIARGQKIETVFDLVGSNENAITYSLGWVLAECNSFRQKFATLLGISGGFSDKMRVRLQDYYHEKGFTDIRLIDSGKYHVIIEAKRGFTVPSAEQLEKYADRLHDSSDAKAQKILVVLAESDRENQWLSQNAPKSIKKIPVQAISWREVQKAAHESMSSANHAEKRWLKQLVQYLGKVTTAQNQNSNMVWVVPLNRKKISDGKSEVTFIDVVEKHGKYFHPVGGRYKVEPPNYIAFRYDSVLQSVHHVKSYTVFEDFHDVFYKIPKGTSTGKPFYLYELGEAIKPAHHTPTNDSQKSCPNLYGPGRHWCFIDLLLTCGSIAEAKDKTKKRQEKPATQNQNSNMVWVVPLNREKFAGEKSEITFIDVVEKHGKYFHPIGGKYPVEPPNYIAFRYDSVLQSVHHVKSYTVFEDFHDVFYKIPKGTSTGKPFYLYELGEAIKPAHHTPTNDSQKSCSDLYGSARHRCFIDLLLTCGSIAKAIDKTKKRQNRLC